MFTILANLIVILIDLLLFVVVDGKLVSYKQLLDAMMVVVSTVLLYVAVILLGIASLDGKYTRSAPPCAIPYPILLFIVNVSVYMLDNAAAYKLGNNVILVMVSGTALTVKVPYILR